MSAIESASPVASGSPKLVYSIDQVLDLTTLSRSTIGRAIKKGKLRAARAGRRTLILHVDLINYLESLVH